MRPDGYEDLGRALAAMADEFRAPLVCATLGEQGSLARCGGREIRTPAFQVDCVDSTGAGDVFRGAFAAGCLRAAGADVEDILEYANAVAAFNCRALGARGGSRRPGKSTNCCGRGPGRNFLATSTVKHFVSSTLAWPLPGRPRPARRADGCVLAARGMSGVTRPADPDFPALDSLDESGLIEACLSGRPGAFDVIVERHRRQVYQLCYRFVGNHEDASDLSQDVFLRAYRGLGNFAGFVARDVALPDRREPLPQPCGRKVSPTEAIDDRQHIDTRSESAADRVLREERAAQVRRAVAALPPEQRATLILRMYHELSHEEIAGILGSSVGAVKANFFHALGNLSGNWATARIGTWRT